MESGELFFKIDPEYDPRKYDTSNKILPSLQSNKVIDENHQKEQGKYNDGKTTDIVEIENQNRNEAKKPEDQNKLLCVACQRIFKNSSRLKNHQNRLVNL